MAGMTSFTGMDNTYEKLGVVGSESPNLVQFAQKIGIESSNVRSIFTGAEFNILDQSQNLYLYGRPEGRNANLPTINYVQGTLNTFTALATRTESAHTLKSASVNEDGPWVLIKPFAYIAKTGPDGQPEINPATGQPRQNMTFQVGQEIPEEIIDEIPASRRENFGTDTVVDFFQSLYDAKRRESRMDQIIRDDIHIKQQQGSVFGLFGWDPNMQLPTYDIYPVQQWFPDPIKADVAKMNYIRVDVPMDSEEAKARWPKLAKFIDENASRALYFETGSTNYSSVYTSVTFQRPVVTMTIVYLRNQQAPMTMQEGLDTRMLAWKEWGDEPDETQTGIAKGGESQVTEIESNDVAGNDSGERGASGADMSNASAGEDQSREVDESGGGLPDQSGTQDQNVARQPQLIHTPTGDDVTSSFDHETGEPAPHPDTKALHPNHPHKLVIRQWIQIRGQVAPDSDMVCPHWDIPVWLDKNVPIMFRPWSQPETERLRSPQQTLNNTHGAMVDHVANFRAPAGFMYRDMLSKVTPEFKNGHMDPSTMYLVDRDNNNSDIRKDILQVDPPPMPAAIPQLKADIGHDYQIVAGNPSVNQGTPPEGVHSGVAIARLQGEAQASQGFKSQFTEEAIWRMGKLTIHALVNWMTVDEILRINRKYSRQIIEMYILPFARNMVWDLEVELPTGGGQIRQEQDAQTRQDYAAKILDPETARDKLRLDAAEISRREKEQRIEIQEEQQAMAPPPKPPESISLSVKYETLPLQAQNAALQMMGLPPVAVPQAPQQASGTPKNAEPQPQPA